jgi:endoglucanase
MRLNPLSLRLGLAGLAVLAALAASPGPAKASPPAERVAVLRRGINFTNWFRFAAHYDSNSLRRYMSDDVLTQLHDAGFTFVRLAVQPEVVTGHNGKLDHNRSAALMDAIRRIEGHGLAVMVGWHLHDWHPETQQADRDRLVSLWTEFAGRLRTVDPALTFPEVLNEPVFPDAASWATLQSQLLSTIRNFLPNNTVVLTGTNWGSVDGLTAMPKVDDPNVVWSIHTYEPALLTTLGAFEPGLDRNALGRLPFPANDTRACERAAAGAPARTADVIRYYCSQHWDAAKLRDSLRPAADWAHRNNAFIVAGEFGASDSLPPATRLAWIAAMRSAMEQEHMGWALWGYDDSMGFDIHPNPDRHGAPAPLDAGLLRALGLHAR